MTKLVKGICRLCGEHKPLSFEHIPPRSAFNDSQRLFQTMQDLLNGKPYSRFRRGIGKDSLCEDCNKRTGGWYGTAFADWSKQGMEWFEKVGGQASIDLPFYTRPLNVIKQIMVMALALSAEQTLNYHYELRRFILNKEALQDFPDSKLRSTASERPGRVPPVFRANDCEQLLAHGFVTR